MSFEALVEARAKRMEKEAAKTTKEKRTRKHKHGTPEAYMLEAITTTAKAAQAIGALRSADVPLLVTETQVVDGASAPCPGRAPVVRTW